MFPKLNIPKFVPYENDGTFEQEDLDQINRCFALINKELTHLLPWRRQRMAAAMVENERLTQQTAKGDDITLPMLERVIRMAKLPVPTAPPKT